MKFIFLDIDGVLATNHTYNLARKMPPLQARQMKILAIVERRSNSKFVTEISRQKITSSLTMMKP